MEEMPESWNRAKELFEAALELDSSGRAAYLIENCADEDLRRQVEKLLANYEKAGSFLDGPFLGTGCLQTLDNDSTVIPDAGESATATIAEVQDPMLGRQLGAYKIVKRVGRGGMAAVYLAARADDEYRKLVAIKVVQPGWDSRDLLHRFRTERQTLASLDHPNIVKLLDGGSTTEGFPFLVMDYVDGSPIDDHCDSRKVCIDDRLRLFCKVCEGVQYAHQKSVVHRDLKPSNILVTNDGTPKLLDFGIAKVLNADSAGQNFLVTQTGTRCMTPAYASPEQIRGKPVTPASDIYSLGVVLYELLSGRRPYRLTQDTPAEIEKAICEQDPETPSTAVSRVEIDTSSEGARTLRTPESVSKTREGEPEQLRKRLRGDLDNIVLKALQKEPERRYDSVQDFARDIERHLEHLPVKARPSTLRYRTSKFVQRHKIEVSASLGLALPLIAAVLIALNMFGVRDRILTLRTHTQSLITRHAFKPRGWVTGSAVVRSPAVSCESLVDLKLPDTAIVSTQSIPEGNFVPPGSDPIPSLPSFCRVEGASKPTADSDIRFELWMPISDWNGEFRGVGNGGFGGAIDYDDMALALRQGYATASTNTGHVGDYLDSRWALGHPEKVIDFGYRAIHEMTEKSKSAVRAFYGQDPRWSIFEGCSNGGREGLLEAQRFPEDYQGVLAGAPVSPATHLLAAAVYNLPASSATYIPASKIPAISSAVLAACDALDGVTDGILSDPRQCHFDPSVLLCRGGDSETCLTAPQAAQLKKIYAGLQSPDGKQIYPGYLPGGEEGEDGWVTWLTGSAPGQGLISTSGIDFFRYMVFENPAWDFRSTSAQRAAAVADLKLGQILNATDPDLRRFKALGGKLILYQGWSDAALSPVAITGYYENIVATLGKADTESFVRLYMAPGMQHCRGGPGPNFFGQLDLATLGSNVQPLATIMDPQHNLSSALEQWLTKGAAPGPVIATKFVDDLDPSQGIKTTRPLCPYPQTMLYKGIGNTNDATSFFCSSKR